MNNNEVPPDYWGGRHSDQPSSAEIVKLIMAELGNLLQTHPQNGGIVINYYNSVGQRIDSVHTQNFATDKWTEPMMPTERKASIPPPEKMAKAVEHTMAKGYWWASTSWAVVYRVY